jgi:hypothetical protein
MKLTRKRLTVAAAAAAVVCIALAAGATVPRLPQAAAHPAPTVYYATTLSPTTGEVDTSKPADAMGRRVATGDYVVTFPAAAALDLTKCAFVATTLSTPGGQSTTASARAVARDRVAVFTFNPAGQPQNLTFNVVIAC